MSTPHRHPPRFATTRWSRILAAAERPAEEAAEALGDLVRAYWYPLYVYLRRRGLAREDAEDTTQGFFVHMLERERLAKADPQRGRFRTFLLACLNHYLANEQRAARAERRGGGVELKGLDFDEAERRYAGEPADLDTPQQLYDRRWAMTLMENAIGRIRSAYERSGKGAWFDALKPYLAGESESGIGRAAQALGVTDNAARVALHRLRRRCRDFLRAEVARTLCSTDDLDDEITSLFSLVQRPT